MSLCSMDVVGGERWLDKVRMGACREPEAQS